MRLMRRLLLIFAFLGLTCVLGAGVLLGPFALRVQHYAAQPAVGYVSDF